MLEENLRYIENIKKFGIKPGLERMEKAIKTLNIDTNKFEIIHITGTNGKGSTSTLTANVLKEAGYKVGLYLSPYVIKFNERIKIDGQDISDEDLDFYITKLRKELESNNLEATFFEFITLMALLYFQEKEIEILVFEVGMGGKNDATNIVNSIISVITNIGLDHQEYLGNTKKEIAIEKAGIIKENQVLVTTEEDYEIKDYLKKVCEEKNTKFISTFDVISVKKEESNIHYQKFSTNGIFKDEFKLSLLGDHQIKNASTVLAIISELQKLGKNIPLHAIKKAFEKTRISGRMEIFSENPLIIIDGAHNPHGILALCNYLKQINNKKTLILAIKNGKDSKEMLDLIVPHFSEIIITKGNIDPKDPKIIAEEAKKYNKNIFIIPDIKMAVKKALEITKENETILITGSLYMIGDAIKHLKELKKHN